MVWLMCLMMLLSSCVNLSWAEIQEIEANIFKDQNQKLECRIFAPDLVVNDTFRVYVNTPDDVKIYRGSCYKTINSIIDSAPLWTMKDTERGRPGYVSTNASWHLPANGIKCIFYTKPCLLQYIDYCYYYNSVFGTYDYGIQCQSLVKIRAQINNTKEIKVNILKDQQDGVLKCEGKTTDLLVNETFQIYVNTSDEDLTLFGGRCFKTRKDDQDTDIPKVNKDFWKKPRDGKHGYVSSMMPPLTRLGIHDWTCEVFTKPCESLYDYYCKYDALLYDEGIKCNMKINIVNPVDIETKLYVRNDYFVIFVAFASITALVIVIAAVWTIICRSRRKRKAPHVSNSSDIDYQVQPRNNEVSKPIPALRNSQKNLYANTSGNTEVPYAAAIPKHLRKPKSDRDSKTEPNYVTVHTQPHFNKGKELNEEVEENEYANLSAQNFTYAVLYHDESKDGGENLRSQSPYVQIRHIDEQNYVNVKQMKAGVEDVYEHTNSTYVNVKNKR